MADNVTLKNGADVDFDAATDDVGGVHYPRAKLIGGADGTATRLDVAEDAAHASGDLGFMALAVRNDTASALAGTDGDYIPLTTNNEGKLHASVFPSPSPVTVAFTPAATSHAAGDSVGGAGAFANVAASGKIIMICGCKLTIPTTTPTNTAYRLWIYNAAIGTPIADDAAFAPVLADETKFLTYIDIPTPIDGGSTLQIAVVDGLAKPILLSGTGLNCYLQNLSTVTFEAVAHNVTLSVYPLN